MSVKLVALATTGTLTVTGASIIAWQLTKTSPSVPSAPEEVSFVSSGKTLKERYPKLTVKKYGGNSGDVMYDNTFWNKKTQEKGLFY